MRDAPKADRDGGGLDEAIRLGRRLGAGSVVLGSAVGTGDRVRLAADFYSIEGERLGRAQVDGPVDSVLTLVDRLSLALLRDVWRSREPLPAVRLASQTTDSIAALRAFLQGEQYYRRLVFDSAVQAYNRAVEVDSTFALAHFRRALTYGWTGGYGSTASLEASAAGTRFAKRLQPRERRLLVGYRLFDQGKPAAVDSFHSFLKEYPDDLDGWYLLGEALFHTREYTGAAPETISAAFDSVVHGDSGLVPALIHPIELTLGTGDTARFRRYLGVIERSAPERGRVWRTLARSVWGPPPADSAVRSLRGHDIAELFSGLYGLYADPAATSDTIIQRFRWGVIDCVAEPAGARRRRCGRRPRSTPGWDSWSGRARWPTPFARRAPGMLRCCSAGRWRWAWRRRTTIAGGSIPCWPRSLPAHGTTTPLR